MMFQQVALGTLALVVSTLLLHASLMCGFAFAVEGGC